MSVMRKIITPIPAECNPVDRPAALLIQGLNAFCHFAELFTEEADLRTAGQTFQTDIHANTHHFKQVPPAGMRFSQLHFITDGDGRQIPFHKLFPFYYVTAHIRSEHFRNRHASVFILEVFQNGRQAAAYCQP